MQLRFTLVVVCCLSCSCYGNSLSVKGGETTEVERIEFKPRSTVDLTDAKKEMLYGSVIWFKPKQKSGEGESGRKDEDVIRLKTPKTVTYRRQNKSLNEQTEKGNKSKQIDASSRGSKEIEVDHKVNSETKNLKTKSQNENQNGRKVQKSDKDLSNVENKKRNKKRRKNNGENRRTNRNRKKNRQHATSERTVDTDSKSGGTNSSPRGKALDVNSEEQNNIKQKKQKKQKQKKQKSKSAQSNPGENETLKSDEIRKDAQEVEAKSVMQLKNKMEEQKRLEKQEEGIRSKPSKADESNHANDKNKNNMEKEKIVQNADLLGLLLAKSDPELVKVLIDNSSPENLNVFLSNSKITVEELKDIVAY